MRDINLTHPEYGQVMQGVELLSFSAGISVEGNVEAVVESGKDIDFFNDGFFAVIDTDANKIADTIEIIHPESEKHHKMPLLAEISGILIARFILKDKIEEETLYVVCPFLDVSEIPEGSD